MIKCGAIKFCFPIKHDKLFKLKEAFFEIIRIVVSVKENSSGSDGKKKKKKDEMLGSYPEYLARNS